VNAKEVQNLLTGALRHVGGDRADDQFAQAAAQVAIAQALLLIHAELREMNDNAKWQLRQQQLAE
jgi:hypothetical protein